MNEKSNNFLLNCESFLCYIMTFVLIAGILIPDQRNGGCMI